MQAVTTIGLDIAKSIQVHGVDAAGQVLIRRQLKRRYVLAFFQKLPPCLLARRATFGAAKSCLLVIFMIRPPTARAPTGPGGKTSPRASLSQAKASVERVRASLSFELYGLPLRRGVDPSWLLTLRLARRGFLFRFPGERREFCGLLSSLAGMARSDGALNEPFR
jgi:hypothetical protein